MGRPGLTYDQFETAVTLIKSEGGVITIRAVRERTSGSPNTIYDYLKIWRSTHPEDRKQSPELPEAIIKVVSAELANCAAAARKNGEEALQSAREEASELAAEGENRRFKLLLNSEECYRLRALMALPAKWSRH